MVNAVELLVGGGTTTVATSVLRKVNVCDWLPPATIEKFEYVDVYTRGVTACTEISEVPPEGPTGVVEVSVG